MERPHLHFVWIIEHLVNFFLTGFLLITENCDILLSMCIIYLSTAEVVEQFAVLFLLVALR